MAFPIYVVPGPCKITFGGQDLGFTKAGVTIRVNTNLIPIVDDEHGAEPADYILGGKSCIVEAAFVDVAKLKAVRPFIGDLLSNMSGAANQVGRIGFDGYVSSDVNVGKILTITERVVTNVWTAKWAMPTDPQQLLLASTQELIMPIQFAISMDENDELFSTVPSYLRE